MNLSHAAQIDSADHIHIMQNERLIAGALLVGLLTAKTLVDWQAIQFYRGEWLLGGTASFVAGILLKKQPPQR